MGKRKVSILEPAATSVAEVSWFIESKGMPQTAKNLLMIPLLFLQNLLTIAQNIKLALIINGNNWAIAVFPIRKNIQ